MALGDTKDVGRRLGMFMSILSLGALAGPPISGAINTATGGFEDVGYYAGANRVYVSVRVPILIQTFISSFPRLLGNYWRGHDVCGSTFSSRPLCREAMN